MQSWLIDNLVILNPPRRYAAKLLSAELSFKLQYDRSYTQSQNQIVFGNLPVVTVVLKYTLRRSPLTSNPESEVYSKILPQGTKAKVIIHIFPVVVFWRKLKVVVKSVSEHWAPSLPLIESDFRDWASAGATECWLLHALFTDCSIPASDKCRHQYFTLLLLTTPSHHSSPQLTECQLG